MSWIREYLDYQWVLQLLIFITHFVYSLITLYCSGLEKLLSTEIEVKDMQLVLEQMKPKLEKAAIVAAKMIEQISRDTVRYLKRKINQ